MKFGPREGSFSLLSRGSTVCIGAMDWQQLLFDFSRDLS